ncbi:MAG: InlB B-repeat-containing protein, partial [Clostridia bacterium]|nr:InlB B-repeat-containing protein [Clostridia bacterium]
QPATKEGYTFEGWYDNAEFTENTVTQIIAGSMGNKTIYAKWKIKTYTITYVLNGGINNESNLTTYNVETSTITLQPLTRTGYTFEGWYDNADFSGDEISEILTGSTGDKTFYAKWEISAYAIIFEPNGGTGIMEPQEFSYGIEESLNVNTFTRLGYTFEGWAASEARANDGIVDYVDEDNYTIGESNVTLYAVWTINVYTITYNLNDGVNDENNPDTYNVETETITLLPSSKIGYTFDGWYDSEDFNGIEVTQIPTGSTEDKVFYAKWIIAVYSITYNLDGGTNDLSNPESYTIETETIQLQDPSKIGYTFGGWYDNTEFTDTPITQIEMGSTEDKIFYAFWIIDIYAITYNLNGGINDENNPETYSIETSTITLQPAMKTGYSFVGWYDNAEFSGDELSQIPTGSTGDRTFYAKWMITIYTIAYHLDNGINDENNPETYTVESETIILQPATKIGYAFLGWNDDPEFNGNVISQIPAGSAGDLILYANWILTFDIDFFDYDGSSLGIASQRKNEGELVDRPIDPTKGECIFDGWYTDMYFTDEYDFDTPVTQDLSLYSKFLVTVIFKVDNSIESRVLILSDVLSTAFTFNPSKIGYSFENWVYLEKNEVLTEETGLDFNLPITLEAMLTPNVYTINFDLSYEDSDEVDEKEVVFDSVFGELPEPKRRGYTFEGWYYGIDLIENSDIFRVPSDITLEARWELISVDFAWIYIASASIVALIIIFMAVLLKKKNANKRYERPIYTRIDRE